MTKNWIAVSVVLLIIAALLGWKLKVSVNRFNAENDLARMQPFKDLKQKLTLEGGIPPMQPPRSYSAAEFGIIPEKNLFAESRAREKEDRPDVAAVPEIPPLAQKPVLVGVTIVGNERLASIIEPTNATRGHRSQTKRLGDLYQGYMITDITENKMILESGARLEIIPLHDGVKRSGQAVKTPVIATRVVNFGGGTGGSMLASATPPVSGSAPRPTQASMQTSTNIGGARASQSGVRPMSSPPGQEGGSAPPTWNEGTDSQGRRVIRTPFGDIVRDKQPNQ
jgi:hypothetical protein